MDDLYAQKMLDLFQACGWGDPDAVRALLAAGVSADAVDGDRETALMWAANLSHIELVQELEKVRDLLQACATGDAASVRALLAAGVSANAMDGDRETPLMYAAHFNHIEVVQVLLDAGANMEAVSEDYRALHWAAMYGNLDIVRLFLERGAEMNATNRWGQTALLRAASMGHTAIVRILLHYGADVSILDEDGKSAADWASTAGHQEIVILLTSN